MNRLVSCLFLCGAVFLTGCASSSKKTELPNSAVATAAASAEQLTMAKIRANAITGRSSSEEKSNLTKGVSLLAVRTLGLTPEQIATLGPGFSDPSAATCVALWDFKRKEVVGSEIYVVKSPPAKNDVARFGAYIARYVGSL